MQRYYPRGYEEGIAVLEDRHAISEQKSLPASPYQEGSISPPHPQYSFHNEPPRQVQLGRPLRQPQRRQFAEQTADGNIGFEIANYENEELQPESSDFSIQAPRRSANAEYIPRIREGPNHRPFDGNRRMDYYR